LESIRSGAETQQEENVVETMTKKVYNFNMFKVENELVKVFKKSRNESTVADLVAKTGLPKYQVEQAVKVVSDEYRGHLKATESGELLYYFPNGMRNQVKGFIPGMKKFLRSFFDVAGKVMAFLFKVWIMFMLVFYFVLFLLILIGSVVAAIAISTAGRGRDSRSSKGGGNMFYLVIKLFELFGRIWFYSKILKGPSSEKGRPLHKSVFAFVFGEPDPNQEWDAEEKKHAIEYIRTHKGVITIEELMVMTGRDPFEAQKLINRYLLEFEGSPDVTDDGTVVFVFPQLLKTASQSGLSQSVSMMNPRRKELLEFSYNPKKSNRLIGFFNGFNLVFGSYFMYFVLTAPGLMMETVGRHLVIDFALPFRFINTVLYGLVQDPAFLIGIVLGAIPLVFSFLFYLIPLIRNGRLKKENEAIRRENFRKRIYANVLANPSSVVPSQIKPQNADEASSQADQFAVKTVDELAGVKKADIEQLPGGTYSYSFKEIEREQKDLSKFRNSVDLKKYAVGETVFDSNA
jgi:hypothetical protein